MNGAQFFKCSALQEKCEYGLHVVEDTNSQQTRVIRMSGSKTSAFVVVDAFERVEIT
jgi:hypothetical protein